MGTNFFDPHTCCYILHRRREFSDRTEKDCRSSSHAVIFSTAEPPLYEVTAAYRTKTSINFAELINILDIGVEHLDIAEVTQSRLNL